MEITYENCTPLIYMREHYFLYITYWCFVTFPGRKQRAFQSLYLTQKSIEQNASANPEPPVVLR